MGDDAAKQHRIRIKLGDAEFDAEGPSDLIERQLQQFLEALAKRPAGRTPSIMAGTGAAPGEARGVGVGEDANEGTDLEVPPELLARIFAQDKNGAVSLRTLPPGKNPGDDALLLLLEGYRQLASQELVLATELMKAATQSGLQLERLDRVLGRQRSYVVSGGRAKGKRYGLNNQGIRRAAQIARTMFG